MGKLWQSLEDAGLPYAVSSLNPLLGSSMHIDEYVNWDKSFQMRFVFMTGKQVHKAAREMVDDVEKYRTYNLDTVQAYADRMPEGSAMNTRARLKSIARMTEAEVLVNMPKFIRICLELHNRGYNLENMFYDKPH